MPRIVATIVVLCGACVHLQPQRSELSQRFEGTQLSTAELRLRVRALASRFSGLLEALADDLVEQSPDTSTRLVALRFKVNAIPALQAALFSPDPVLALLDAWALLAQLDDALQEELLPPEQDRLVRRYHAALSGELERLWSEFAGEASVARTRERIEAWAEQHPVTHGFAARSSAAELLTELTAHESWTLTGAATELLETTADLAARADLQAAFLPKNARWQAELLLLEMLVASGMTTVGAPASPSAAPPDPAPAALLRALEDATLTAARFPSIIEHERVAGFEAMRGERLELQRFIVAERAASFAETDSLVRGWIDVGALRAERLVDRIFRWLLLLTALLIAGALAAAALALHRFRREPGGKIRLVERKT